jgi:hypothetical protein
MVKVWESRASCTNCLVDFTKEFDEKTNAEGCFLLSSVSMGFEACRLDISK